MSLPGASAASIGWRRTSVRINFVATTFDTLSYFAVPLWPGIIRNNPLLKTHAPVGADLIYSEVSLWSLNTFLTLEVCLTEKFSTILRQKRKVQTDEQRRSLGMPRVIQ